VRARRAAIPRICEWPPSIIHPPSPTSMLVCSRRTTVAAHILDAVSAWPPRARPQLAACPSSSARNRLCKSVWRATAELSGGCPPGEAWMEPALNCIETGMATACAERGSEQRAECESDIRCNERRRHPAAYEAWPLSAWQGARRRSPASRSHRRRSSRARPFAISHRPGHHLHRLGWHQRLAGCEQQQRGNRRGASHQPRRSGKRRKAIGQFIDHRVFPCAWPVRHARHAGADCL
jgi:hypothetical protein